MGKNVMNKSYLHDIWKDHLARWKCMHSVEQLLHWMTVLLEYLVVLPYATNRIMEGYNTTLKCYVKCDHLDIQHLNFKLNE